jgi:hypothetical protein
MLLRQLSRCFRMRIKRNEPFVTEIEKREYDKLVLDYRQKNTEMYWDIQTEVENAFISELRRPVQRSSETQSGNATSQDTQFHRQGLKARCNLYGVHEQKRA